MPMKTSCPHSLPFIVLAACLALPGSFAPAQEAPAPPPASAVAQAEAVKKYPPLGVAGSAFNREFLAGVQKARAENPSLFDDPAWPLALADEIARALPPADTPTPNPLADWYSGHTAETFSQLPLARQKLDREALDHAFLSAAIFHATNAARRSQKLRPLIPLPALREAAWGHSRDMALGGFFSHGNPRDPAKASPFLRLDAAGAKNMAAGENISSLGAGGYTYWGYARAVVAQWMKSPGHRANILRANYTHLGCGAHPCGCPHFHLLATQDFAFVVR